MCQQRERGRKSRGERERKVAGAKAVALKYGQLNCQTVNFVLTSLKNFSLLRHEGRVYTGGQKAWQGKRGGGQYVKYQFGALSDMCAASASASAWRRLCV